MRRARFILPFKLFAKTFVYTETDDVIGTVTPVMAVSEPRNVLTQISVSKHYGKLLLCCRRFDEMVGWGLQNKLLSIFSRQYTRENEDKYSQNDVDFEYGCIHHTILLMACI